jgi:hypothetical protein
MAKLGYLKVGNTLKQHTSSGYSNERECDTIKIEKLKINKATVLINDIKYKIVGNNLVLDIYPVKYTLSPIDGNYDFNDNLEKELVKLERKIRSIGLLIDNARDIHLPNYRNSLYETIKSLNTKLQNDDE